MAGITINISTRELLIQYAEKYETADFINGDPSWFMHQVSGAKNQEAMAFIAASLSYGSRQQFMKKIQLILDWAQGDVDIPDAVVCSSDETASLVQQLLNEYGTLGDYVRGEANDTLGAVDAICRYFGSRGISVIIPKDTTSACKRVCMFLRWMVRTNSPVDLGLWADFIDRRSLIIPLDTHVLQQSERLGLITSKTASMTAARKLSAVLATIFPDDPLKGDFALFGHGVNS